MSTAVFQTTLGTFEVELFTEVMVCTFHPWKDYLRVTCKHPQSYFQLDDSMPTATIQTVVLHHHDKLFS